MAAPEEILRKVHLNLNALANCFNVIQSVIKERQSTLDQNTYCDTFTLSLAGKMIYERWEKEKRLLQDITGQRPAPNQLAPPTTLELPENLRTAVASTIKDSLFYKHGVAPRANQTKP